MARRVRLIAGIILLVFVTTHLMNLMLGIWSLEALERGRLVFLFFWRSWPGTVLLYGALLVHLGLAFWAIYQRQDWRMSLPDLTILLLGLAIPPLLVVHILGNRMAHEVFGVQDTYVYDLLVFFVLDQTLGWRQVALVLVAWLHGCLGLHFWLRLKSRYGPWQGAFFAGALLVPVFALFGMWTAGQTVSRLAEDPAWLAAAFERINMPSEQAVTVIAQTTDGIMILLAGLLVATLVARGAKSLWRRRRGMVQISYPQGRRVTVPTGTSILDASRTGAIPHASICGGRGRCSTCRVRISGSPELSPPSLSEIKVLARIGAAPDVRLACQTPAMADLAVIPLLPPTSTLKSARSQPDYLRGDEREIAVLFADLRGFTTLAEHKLPYDVVFILNRYFAAMGRAVEQSGGRLDKFIGDGVMALFGVEKGLKHGSRQALKAAYHMAEQLEELNLVLQQDLDSPLRIGIGIHGGTAIVGEMGYGDSVSITAIGDTVNTASRLETMTKTYAAQLVVSENLFDLADLDGQAFARHEIEVRGRARKLGIRVVPNARDLPLSSGLGSAGLGSAGMGSAGMG